MFRKFIADGGYSAAQFIRTGVFSFSFTNSTSTLDLELRDIKTVYSLLLHLVDDRHPRIQGPFFRKSYQTNSLSFPISEIKTRVDDCD